MPLTGEPADSRQAQGRNWRAQRADGTNRRIGLCLIPHALDRIGASPRNPLR